MEVFKRTPDEEDNDRESAEMWAKSQGMAIPRTPHKTPTDKSYKPIKIRGIKFTGCPCDFCKRKKNEQNLDS